MLTIAWDVDDVLNDLMGGWLHAWVASHPGREIAFEDLTSNPPLKAAGANLDEYLESLDRFRLDGGMERMAPRPEALEWFRRHGERFRHIAVTAVPLRCAAVSASWVMRHFGTWIRSFHFVPSPRAGATGPEYFASKADFLEWWGKADALVDDSPAHVDAARKIGLTGILVPRPWNGGRGSWEEALSVLERM